VGTVVIHDALKLWTPLTVIALGALAVAFFSAGIDMARAATFYDDEGTRVRLISMSREYLGMSPSERVKELYIAHFWASVLLISGIMLLAVNILLYTSGGPS
jgi:hypothetical protein